MHNVKMPKKATFKPEREIVALESDEVRAVERIAEMKNKMVDPVSCRHTHWSFWCIPVCGAVSF